MPERSVETRCPACDLPVFDGANVVRCSRCEALHHEPCWERRRACAARAACRGKPQPVVVVRLPAELDAAELSVVAGRAAADHVTEHVLPRIEAQVATRASESDLAAARETLGERVDAIESALRELVVAEASRLRAEIDQLRTKVESATSTVRALGANTGAVSQELVSLLEPILDARIAAVAERTLLLRDEVLAGMGTATQGLHEKLDATHFALEGSRRPFPWEVHPVDDPELTTKDEGDA